MTSLDDAIEISSLRQQVMRRIRAAIVYGEIAPGEIHSAPALAQRLGVSITPVREALIELTHRGMVTQVRNRGFRVVEHTPAELDAALELRGLVEVPMTGGVAGTLNAAAVAELESMISAGVEAAAAGDLGAFLEIDRRFHLGLLRRAGNARVVEVVDQVLDQLRLAVFHDASSLVAVAEGHREILAALVAGDRAAAEDAVRRHLALTRTAWGHTAARSSDAA